MDAIDNRSKVAKEEDELLPHGTLVDIKNPQQRGWQLATATITNIRDDRRSYILEEKATGRRFIRTRSMVCKNITQDNENQPP